MQLTYLLETILTRGLHYFRLCLFPGKWFSGNHFPNFSVFVCHHESWSTENTLRSTENTFQSKENFAWFPGKCFPFILGGKHFPEVVKNLEMSYYLLIISNLVLKLLIAIYILFWIFVFQFHPLKLNFYINLWNVNYYYYFNFFIFQFFLFFRFDLYYFDYYLFYLR
jgi:hypothetical protein